jgi:hypothetical protein
MKFINDPYSTLDSDFDLQLNTAAVVKQNSVERLE